MNAPLLSLLSLKWQRHAANPILPPVDGSNFDSHCCMNPFVVRDGDGVQLYYAGADSDGHRRICLASASFNDLTNWQRHGPLFERGQEGEFDANWCVLPCVHEINGKTFVYYSGNEGFGGEHEGLQSFPGIGLATSEDGTHFTKYSDKPIITGDQSAEFPDNRGIAGGGTILEDHATDGSISYRMYYTLAVGTPNKDMRIDQEKHNAVCHSTDGIEWTDHRVIMSPRKDVSREDAAVAAPFVWRDTQGLYRMIYCPIGTRWGAYSLAQAVSEDGYTWHRGEGDENIVLMPDADNPDAWDHQMVEYPSLMIEGNKLILFYCGNEYGNTGIGIAEALIESP